MYVSNTPRLARVNNRPIAETDNRNNNKSNSDTAASANNGKNDSPSTNNSKLTQQLGDEAQKDFIQTVNLKPISKPISPALTETFELAQAQALFATLDAQNPSLVVDSRELSFISDTSYLISVSAGTGGQNSALFDLRGGAQVFVYSGASGKPVAYQVENGQLTNRIPEGERVDLGGGRSIEIPSDGSEILMQAANNSYIRVNNELNEVSVRQNIPFSWNRDTEMHVVLENMTTQQQFDHYAGTPEGKAILDLEGNLYNTDAEKRMFVARVGYLRNEGGVELFNEFTPRRATLSGDELKAYDAEIEKVTNHLRENAYNTVSKLPVGGADNPDQLDESMLYLLASAIVEKHGASSERIDTVLEDLKNNWIVSIDNADAAVTGAGAATGTSAGWYRYSPEGSTIQLSLPALIRDISQPSDNFDILAHELAHSLDLSDGTGDGIPKGMSAANAHIVRDERTRLFELAYPGQTLDLTVNQDTATVVDASNIRPYAYTNEREFWSAISEQFLGSDAGAARLMKTSPELYDVLRDYYERDDLPASSSTVKPPIVWPPVIGPRPPITLPPSIGPAIS